MLDWRRTSLTHVPKSIRRSLEIFSINHRKRNVTWGQTVRLILIYKCQTNHQARGALKWSFVDYQYVYRSQNSQQMSTSRRDGTKLKELEGNKTIKRPRRQRRTRRECQSRSESKRGVRGKQTVKLLERLDSRSGVQLWSLSVSDGGTLRSTPSSLTSDSPDGS